MCFPVNISKFLRAPFLQNTSGRLLLFYWFLLRIVVIYTAQKMKFSIKGFFSKYDQIGRKLRIWSHLLQKSLIENFFPC